MKTIWKVFAWISMSCGLLGYGTGWVALLNNGTFWNIPAQFGFYDAIAAGIFALFFVIYGTHSAKSK
ncbi:MAG: hypothetical protein AABY26_03985 [Nanoarchaeota archaeon]